MARKSLAARAIHLNKSNPAEVLRTNMALQGERRKKGKSAGRTLRSAKSFSFQVDSMILGLT